MEKYRQKVALGETDAIVQIRFLCFVLFIADSTGLKVFEGNFLRNLASLNPVLSACPCSEPGVLVVMKNQLVLSI